jgi:hypothetical protein
VFLETDMFTNLNNPPKLELLVAARHVLLYEVSKWRNEGTVIKISLLFFRLPSCWREWPILHHPISRELSPAANDKHDLYKILPRRQEPHIKRPLLS